MDIPPLLLSILSQKQILLGSVNTNLARFSNWLQQSRMPFFPEDTDHSLGHLEEVLRLAEYLICESREFEQSVMTAEDSAVLVLAVLLHDVAKHLTKDGFLRILSTDDPWRKIQGFDEDEAWPELWARYLREARHWRVDELRAVFGSTTPVTRSSNDSLDNLTEHDHLLIGEFIRRHHPRLAHEMAINGVPAAGPKLLTLEGFDGEFSALPDLAGLVARSHGMPLRGTFGYLESKYQRIGFLRNTHVVYLMAVLRIADYLHIYSRRAPREMRLVRAERSTVSRREWDAHSAVSDINLGAPEDPESVYIEVDPDEIKNTYVFNRLSDWISGIQEELDHAWAVLGELYGNNERLRRLALALRRVKTNLYDRTFLTQLPFHPVIASFQVTSRLIPLFIEPMYGNNPAFGIRELIQNSVDAVREARCFYAQRLHDWRKADWPTLQGLPNSLDLDVAVRICHRALGQKNSPDEIPSDWDYWLEVADRGIGMSPVVVRDYLLRIGATFRDSETWQRLFGDDGTGVRVLRSGYFGIGILAAFLLGKEMQVTTSSLIEPEIGGVTFVSRIDVGTVDMLRISRPHGTTVRIHVTGEMANWLHENPSQWRWYQLPDPKVGRFLLGKSSPLNDQNPLPSPENPLPATYRSLKKSGYRDVHWTLIAGAPFLSCNGIVIKQTGDIKTYMKVPKNCTRDVYDDVFDMFEMPRLAVSVFDAEAKLPINLTRTDLQQQRFTFSKQLRQEIVLDFIAHLLAYAPQTLPDNSVRSSQYEEIIHPARFRTDFAPLGAWGALHNGVIFIGSRPFARLGVSSILLYDNRWCDPHLGMSDTFDVVLERIVSATRDRQVDCIAPANFYKISDCITVLVSLDKKDEIFSSIFPGFHVEGVRLLLSKYKKSRELPTPSWIDKGWALYENGNIPRNDSHIRNIAASHKPVSSDCVIMELQLKLHEDPVRMHVSPIERLWRQLVGVEVIPHESEERRQAMEHIPHHMKEYFHIWASIKSKSSKHIL